MPPYLYPLKFFSEGFLSLFFPWQCPLCQTLGETAGVCGPCFSKISFITETTCVSCGLPLDLPLHLSDSPQCLSCAQAPPPLKEVRSAFFYDNHSRNLILHFKYYRKFETTPLLANWLWTRGKLMCENVDALIPIPLHWWKLYRRTFNQAVVLGNALAKKSGVPCLPRLLRKVRHTPTQASLGFKMRESNIKNAFAVHDYQKEWVKGKRLLLIDDVLTTGATLRACAQTLLKAGAKEVSALTLAYVDKRHLPEASSIAKSF